MTTEQPALTPRPKRKRRRWIIAVVAAAVLLAGAGTAWSVLRPKVPTVGIGDTTLLAAGTLTNSISATGAVSSASSAKVYSSLTYLVTTVNAEVGQAVKAGEQLAQLDTAALDKQIASKEASMTQAQAASAASVAAAENKYNASSSALRNGTNPSVVNAQTALTTANDNWQKANKTYQDAKNALRDGQNSQLVSAQTALDNAKANVTSATYAEQTARDAWEAALEPELPDPTKVALDQAVNALDAATTSCQNAQAAFDAASTSADNSVSDLKAAADQAYRAYTNAQLGVAAARASAKTEVQGGADSVESSQASSRQDAAVTDLAGLMRDRASATIIAPVDGTVTAVNAVVGAPAAGVLFVVESPDRLQISSSVNEYDANTVQPGMRVLITSDATRDAVFNGSVSSVAPASTKDAAGDTITGSDIQYATTIDVTSTDTGLKIGMNTRVQYVIDQQTDVLSVPADAVYANAEGAQVVLVIASRPGGDYTLEEVPVTLGVENDIDVAISGTGISAGTRVLNSPTKYQAGTVVSLSSV